MKKDDFLTMTAIMNTLVEGLGANPKDLLSDEQSKKYFELSKKHKIIEDEDLKCELLRLFEKLKKKLK